MTPPIQSERGRNALVDEVPIKGDGFGLTLRVGDYERAATGEVWDDNWLRGAVDIDIAQPPTATFRAKCDVAWQTTELRAFHESLRTLLDDLTGTAKLTTIEDQVELTIELNSGKGTLTGRIEAHAVAALEFEAAIEQTFLADTLTALRAVVTKYPYRG
jgi:hypothetical protein